MALRIKENGRLDLSSVEELNPDDLSDWIRARLHETDTAVPDDPRQQVGQYYVIGAIYKDLRPDTQAEIRRILIRFLRQLADGHDDWQGEPAHHLLLLVMEIQEPSLAEPIRMMAERTAFKQGDEELYARLVQTLIYLDEKVTPEFWKALVQRDAKLYASLAFSGLLMHSLYQALGLLRHLDMNDDAIQAKLYPALRGLLASKRYNHDDLRVIFGDMQTALSQDASAFILSMIPEVATDDGMRPEPDDYSEARTVLGEQGYEPECVDLCLS